jgi:hypothetical protein
MPPARSEIAILAKMESQEEDLKPFAEWQVPVKESSRPRAFVVAAGRLAAAQGDLDGGAPRRPTRTPSSSRTRFRTPSRRTGTNPVRQSLGAIRLRQGRPRRRGEGVPRFARASAQQRLVLAALAQTYEKEGRPEARDATRNAFKRTWFGDLKGPDLARL